MTEPLTESQAATTEAEPRWNELMIAPEGHAAIEREPDGAFSVHWQWGAMQVTLLLDADQIRKLVSDGLNVTMLTGGQEPRRYEPHG